jgi:HAD superfamily hydrolase (TIGR01484 family)
VRHEVSARGAAAVRRVQAAGVRFVPTSGRTPHAMRILFGELLDELDVVASNGLDVLSRGEAVFHATTPHEDAQRLARVVMASPRGLGFAVFQDDGFVYVLDQAADFIHANVESMERAAVRPRDEPLAPAGICKVAVVAPHLDGEEAARELAAVMGDRFTFAPTGPYWVDVVSGGATKLTGARLVMGRLGAADDEVLAVGDSLNDAALLAGLPRSVAMANAMPQAKELCAYEIGSNADEAVADLLERIAQARTMHV